MAKLGNQEKLKRLQKHLAILKSGGSVSKRDMQSLLSGEQMQQFEDQWQNARGYKQAIIDARWELESYTKKLKIADAIWTRYEDTNDANKKEETEYAAESAYESALEHLQELMNASPYIELYLDRPVSFVAGHECAPATGEVPRYKLSRSHHAISPLFQSKRETKQIVIEDAINDLLQPTKQPHAVQKPANVAQTLAKFRKHRKGI